MRDEVTRKQSGSENGASVGAGPHPSALSPQPFNIGVLALQGDFAEHAAVLRQLGVTPVEVRLPRDLEGLDGVIIPGGESTTITRLMAIYDLLEPLREFVREG